MSKRTLIDILAIIGAPISRIPGALPRMQFTVRRIILVVACLAPIFAFIGIPVRRRARFSSVHREIRDRIDSLTSRVLQGIDPSQWECACGWIATAHANICFSEWHVPAEEMDRLRDDLESNLRGPAGAGLLT